ncbi:MAG: T9SS type A sorting domain-containing protein [Saprospiraceae bacterium]|nr:T9SS type A sorting domain-containing protein [Saprospiraceae bacterium]
MNIKIIILLLIPFVAKSQFKIENLSQARSGIAYDFIGDTIMFVGGADTDVVDFYNITNGVKTQQKYTNSDAFSSASTASSKKYSLFYNLFGVNLSLRDLYVYDKVLNKWYDAKDSRVGGKLVEIKDDKVYSYGQKDSIGIYDLISKKVTKLAFPVKESNFSICRSNDQIFFIGGNTGDTFSNKIYIYNVQTDNWSSATLTRARRSPTVAYHDNKIIIAGGFNDFSNKLEIFDLISNTSKELNLPMAISDPILLVNKDELLVGAGDRNTIVKVDFKNLTIDQPYTLEATANFSGLVRLKGSIIGNRAIFAGDRFPRIYIFDFETDKWEIIGIPNIIKFASVFTYKDKLYIAGGVDEDQNNKYSKEIFIFDNLTSSTEFVSTDKNDIIIYPNPGNDLIKYESFLNDIVSYCLFDNLGNMVLEGKNNEINISHLPVGFYSLLLKTSNNLTFVKRVLKN